MRKQKFIKTMIAMAAALFISAVSVNAFAESNNMALAQYYAALAAMGGNETVSVAEAQQLAYDYAVLAQQEDNGGAAASAVAAPVAEAPAPTTQLGTIKITNKNASDQFYNQQVAVINNMYPGLKNLLAQYNAEFITTATGADFGQSSASGMCQATQTKKGKTRSLKLVIYLAESPVNPNGIHTVYHETAHALDSIIWQQTGKTASSTKEFKNADAGETDAMYSLYIGNNMINDSSEHFADAVAAFYIKNQQLAAVCPKLYNYCLAHCPL